MAARVVRPLKRVSKAIGAGAGGGLGLGAAALLLPETAPWYAHALVIVAVAFVTTYFAPRNADDDS